MSLSSCPVSSSSSTSSSSFTIPVSKPSELPKEIQEAVSAVLQWPSVGIKGTTIEGWAKLTHNLCNGGKYLQDLAHRATKTECEQIKQLFREGFEAISVRKDITDSTVVHEFLARFIEIIPPCFRPVEITIARVERLIRSFFSGQLTLGLLQEALEFMKLQQDEIPAIRDTIRRVTTAIPDSGDKNQHVYKLGFQLCLYTGGFFSALWPPELTTNRLKLSIFCESEFIKVRGDLISWRSQCCSDITCAFKEYVANQPERIESRENTRLETLITQFLNLEKLVKWNTQIDKIREKCVDPTGLTKISLAIEKHFNASTFSHMTNADDAMEGFIKALSES